MRRLINILFWISDITAWLVVFISTAFAVFGPVLLSNAALLWGEPQPSVIAVVKIVACSTSVAGGACLLARRRLVGFVAIFCACIAIAVFGGAPFAVLLIAFLWWSSLHR